MSGEPFAAVVTGEWPFPRVSSSVSNQVTSFPEAFLAVGTLQGHLGRVNLLVVFERFSCGEDFSTVDTMKWLVSNVDSQVSDSIIVYVFGAPAIHVTFLVPE